MEKCEEPQVRGKKKLSWVTRMAPDGGKTGKRPRWVLATVGWVQV